MPKKLVLLSALMGVLYATATFALTGAIGNADRIALREGYSQYEGKIDLRDAANVVTFYYWGGTRCRSTTRTSTARSARAGAGTAESRSTEHVVLPDRADPH